MTDNILLAFGARVKELRLAKELSQEKLAQICELDRTYISGIERGIRNVGLLNVKKLSDALEISPSELLRFGDDNV
ncbi:helix-turn-helix domain-containing protein [Leucothrix mucor]|uniref:helix-turn-helix domain-containing protein n=1 Tax=Leucothrix mucor TaxID=45248 RepID=UPI0003B3FCC2|nr:helix-turn-helix transcriptional regulator [Leucothrix mucor]